MTYYSVRYLFIYFLGGGGGGGLPQVHLKKIECGEKVKKNIVTYFKKWNFHIDSSVQFQMQPLSLCVSHRIIHSFK